MPFVIHPGNQAPSNIQPDDQQFGSLFSHLTNFIGQRVKAVGSAITHPKNIIYDIKTLPGVIVQSAMLPTEGLAAGLGALGVKPAQAASNKMFQAGGWLQAHPVQTIVGSAVAAAAVLAAPVVVPLAGTALGAAGSGIAAGAGALGITGASVGTAAAGLAGKEIGSLLGGHAAPTAQPAQSVPVAAPAPGAGAVIGPAAGAGVGFLAGGPIGALVGAGAGYLLGRKSPTTQATAAAQQG